MQGMSKYEIPAEMFSALKSLDIQFSCEMTADEMGEAVGEGYKKGLDLYLGNFLELCWVEKQLHQLRLEIAEEAKNENSGWDERDREIADEDVELFLRERTRAMEAIDEDRRGGSNW